MAQKSHPYFNKKLTKISSFFKIYNRLVDISKRLRALFIMENSTINEAARINKPIFIVGCGRSGTTLLFNLLKIHPQLCATRGYPDGEDHVGWIKHGDCIISGLGSHASVDGGHTGFHYCLHMDENDVSPDIKESMTLYYYEDVLLGDATKRVLNKNPHLSNKLRYVKAIFPDAKFIHIIRDCLPVVSSWIKIMDEFQPYQVLYLPDTVYPCFWTLPAPNHGTRENIFIKEKKIYPGGGATIFVDYWSAVNQNIPIQLKDCPKQLLTIKYEELTKHPMETLNRICDFCEIPDYSEIPLEIETNYNKKYMDHLTNNQIVDFLERAKETRSQFGYF